MTSVVDLCNMALAYLGEEANVSSVDPPEGSPAAESCGRFYPIALDTLLASHPWGFATLTGSLSLLNATYGLWQYAYACPTDMLSLIEMTSNEVRVQEFARETDGHGKEVILCNAQPVLAKYTSRMTDATLFPPLFAQALSWQLASLLAGPMMKGEAGAKQAQRCVMLAAEALEKAKLVDTKQTRLSRSFEASWLKARRGWPE